MTRLVFGDALDSLAVFTQGAGAVVLSHALAVLTVGFVVPDLADGVLVDVAKYMLPLPIDTA